MADTGLSSHVTDAAYVTPAPPGATPTLGVDRLTFLARVRAALERKGRTTAPPPPPAVDERIARLARPGDDLVEMFAARAALAGMKVHRLRAADLVKRVLALVEEIGAKRVVVGVGSVPQALGLNESLRRKGIEIVDWAASPGLGVQFDTQVGITDVHAALAETGTLICCSDAGHSRGLSLVPPAHLAIVRRSDLLPDMLDFWARLKGIPGAELPSSIAFITGPSKTADIEGELVVGVHGPGRVDVLLVEDV